MKKVLNKYLVSTLSLLLVVVVGCKDYNNLDVDPVDSGNVDFSNYVAVGNSLTAGYRNAALFESAQEFSYPNLLARQFRVAETFSQPLISDPGIGGRLELAKLQPSVVKKEEGHGNPINQDEKPFSNLGIPGAVLVDYVNPDNSGHLKERATNKNHPAFNPLYRIVLSKSNLAQKAPSIHKAVKRQNPTFITFWLGANDVLGYVIAGGEGAKITVAATFNKLYKLSGAKLDSTGADVVLYNIPNVTNIPYVFLMRSKLEKKGIITLNKSTGIYELTTPNGSLVMFMKVNGNLQLLRKDDFILLSAKKYFAKVKAGKIKPPVKPQWAIPDKFILDSSEQSTVSTVIKKYNTVIRATARKHKFALVDINKIFTQIFKNFKKTGGGYDAGSLVLKPVPGSLISLDGIHPTNRGYAVIANETIKVINKHYEANVPFIDVSDIPRGLAVTSE